jgi:hypothetical protein
MKIEVPAIAGRLFARLTHGDDLLLSRNGPNEDAELFAQLEADEPGCEAYFSTLGYPATLARSAHAYRYECRVMPLIFSPLHRWPNSVARSLQSTVHR